MSYQIDFHLFLPNIKENVIVHLLTSNVQMLYTHAIGSKTIHYFLYVMISLTQDLCYYVRTALILKHYCLHFALCQNKIVL